MNDRFKATLLAILYYACATENAPPVLGQEAPVARGSSFYKAAYDAYLHKRDAKIVGGFKAPLDAFPWQVALVLSKAANPYRGQFCGGALLSTTWVLTAAHCVVDNLPEDIDVISGTSDISNGGLRNNVKRILIPDEFPKAIKPPQVDDIALLELWDPIIINKHTQVIAIATTDEVQTTCRQTRPIVSGWGTTSEGSNQTTKTLLYARVPCVDPVLCNSVQAYNHRVTATMLCAGGAQSDACLGDSGGPLVTKAPGGKLIGIVNAGVGCGEEGEYGIYASAPALKAWIDGVMQGTLSAK